MNTIGNEIRGVLRGRKWRKSDPDTMFFLPPRPGPGKNGASAFIPACSMWKRGEGPKGPTPLYIMSLESEYRLVHLVHLVHHRDRSHCPRWLVELWDSKHPAKLRHCVAAFAGCLVGWWGCRPGVVPGWAQPAAACGKEHCYGRT